MSMLAAGPPDLLVDAAMAQIGVTKQYDGRYTRIPYPDGDVALERGVCTDVLIRAYRKLGLDLQRLVHEDMVAAWASYPNPWRMKSTDRSIDHRRVPNLATFFGRHGSTLAISGGAAAYQPGDIVTWRLPNGPPHIGIVSKQKSSVGIPLMIHNIGFGTQLEDILFRYKITGHFHYFPDAPSRPN